MVASTWLGDHQRRPSAPLNRCQEVSKCGTLTHILQLQLQYNLYLYNEPNSYSSSTHRSFTLTSTSSRGQSKLITLIALMLRIHFWILECDSSFSLEIVTTSTATNGQTLLLEPSRRIVNVRVRKRSYCFIDEWRHSAHLNCLYNEQDVKTTRGQWRHAVLCVLWSRGSNFCRKVSRLGSWACGRRGRAAGG